MKKSILAIAASVFITTALLTNCGGSSTTETSETETATDSTGLPGDNFSLAGALELFKNATSLESFEKMINDESNKVNNLDMNGDSTIDYIRVIDNTDGNAHAIVLQATLAEDEAQDVAVIEIEKTTGDSAFLQIVGDKDLYNDNGIVEPLAQNNFTHRNTASFGPMASVEVTVGIGVNVMFWSCVAYIYEPTYVIWVSPWYWGYYPPYWHPWKPYPWHIHHNHSMHYMKGYNKVYKHKMKGAHGVYGPHKKSSMMTHGKYKGPNGNNKMKNEKQNGKNDNKTFNKQNNDKKGNNTFNKQNQKNPLNTKQNKQNTKQNQKTNQKNSPSKKQNDGGSKKKGK